MTEFADPRPLAAVLVSLVGAVLIVASYRRPNVREGWTVLAAVTKFGIVASMLPGVLDGRTYERTVAEFLPGIELALRADGLGVLFAFLASGLWILTSFYSIGYMRGLDEHGQTRYFASFAVSLSATMGVAFAANLVTLFVFYELLTVATYPLVTHDETEEARAAGRKYLAYTIGGGVAVLAGTVAVFLLGGTTEFTAGGIGALASADPAAARAAFALLAAGFGVKAALMPIHSWLPDAMVAPTPVSGLLHAVAVVKSGVFGVARVVLDVFGPETVGALGVGLPLAVVAAFTLTAASVIALRQDNLKRRLAYSTVSQLSYIVLGLGLLHPTALVGGLLHIPAHAFMKLTLFFCAGAIHVETHTDNISQMAGIGKRMPLTMAAFAVGAAGMAGIPLIAGFVSKWYLLIGSVSAGRAAFAAVLLVSGVINVAYFWPIVYAAFFESAGDHDPKPLIEAGPGGERRSGRAATDGGRDDHAGEDERPAEAESADSEPAREPTGDGPSGGEPTVIEPEFEPSERDFSDPAETIEGEYAVDRNPSDHLEGDTPGPGAGDDDHHGGPPPGGWERAGWRGGEASWFVVAPILLVAAGAVVLGIVPYEAAFLRLIELVVGNATGGGL